MRKFRRALIIISTTLIFLVGFAFWWLLLEGKAPDSAYDEFKIGLARSLIEAEIGNLPFEMRIETVGRDVGLGFAAETGNFTNMYEIAYTSLQLVWPDKSIVIGGAVDQDTAAGMVRSKKAASFDQNSYQRVTAAMLEADQVLITHEHLDHVMAVVRHPDPKALAPKLRLNKPQLAALPQFAQEGELPPAFAAVTPIDTGQPTLIAPGVVAIPSPGHTAGTLSFFIRLESGAEYLLIGDIVWAMSNIENLKTRPRLLQYVLFDPKEDRKAVLRQVRALHNLQRYSKEIVIVPSHDAVYLNQLIAEGHLSNRFLLPSGDL